MFTGVVVLSWFANLFRVNKLSYVDQFVMAYGGLRGAIAFSLVILLDGNIFQEKKLLITTTVVVVYVTVFVMVRQISATQDALQELPRFKSEGGPDYFLSVACKLRKIKSTNQTHVHKTDAIASSIYSVLLDK